MLFAIELTNESISGLQVVALALVAGWVTVRTRQIDAALARQQLQSKRQRARCDALQRRVRKLERDRDTSAGGGRGK